MSSHDYVQCLLERGMGVSVETFVGWIPVDFAVLGKRVEFKRYDDNGHSIAPDRDWVVREVYSRVSWKGLVELENSREPFVRVLGGDTSEWDRMRATQDCWY